MLPIPCSAPITVLQLEARLEAAQAAYVRMDVDAFADKLDVARAALPCLVEPLGPRDAARYHQIEALAAFVRQDDLRAFSALRSLFVADPSYALPAEITPPGNPLTSLVDAARAGGGGAGAPVAVPEGYVLRIDGAQSDARPNDRPFIVQMIVSGRPLYSGYLQGGDPLPEGVAPAVAVATPGPLPTEPTPPARRALSVPLVGGAGVSAIAAAGLYGWALSMRGDYDDLQSGLSREELDALRGRTNAAVYASAGAGALSVGLAGVAVLSW